MSAGPEETRISGSILPAVLMSGGAEVLPPSKTEKKSQQPSVEKEVKSRCRRPVGAVMVRAHEILAA